MIKSHSEILVIYTNQHYFGFSTKLREEAEQDRDNLRYKLSEKKRELDRLYEQVSLTDVGLYEQVSLTDVESFNPYQLY